MRADAQLARPARRRGAPDGVRQPQRRRADRPVGAEGHRRVTATPRTVSAAPRPGDRRGGPLRPRRCRARRPLPRPRSHGLHRRLRHRLLVARPARRPAGRPGQDRQVVRGRRPHRRSPRRPHQQCGRARRAAGLPGRRRGRRDARAAAAPQRRRLPPAPGLLPRAPSAGPGARDDLVAGGGLPGAAPAVAAGCEVSGGSGQSAGSFPAAASSRDRHVTAALPPHRSRTLSARGREVR